MVVNITSDSIGAAVIAHPGDGEGEEMPVPQRVGDRREVKPENSSLH